MRNKIILLLAVLFLASCNTGLKDVKLPVNTTLPIIDFDISDTQLLEWAGLKDNLAANKEGILGIESSNEIEFNKNNLKDIFTISNQILSQSIKLPGITNSNIPAFTFTSSFNLQDNADIQSAIIENGELSFYLTNSNASGTNLKCTFNNITRNGVKLTIAENELINLSGYRIDFLQNNAINYTIEGNISSGTDIDLSLFFNNLTFSEIEGFVGRKEIFISETSTITIGKDVTDFFENCKYYIANPAVTFQIANGYGIPMLVKIQSIIVNNEELGLKQDKENIGVLIKPYGNSSFIINNQSTVIPNQLSQLLSKEIKDCQIKFVVIANPTKDDLDDPSYEAPLKNIINMNSSISVKEMISIPLTGEFENIAFSETIVMDLDIDSQNTIYEYIKLAVTSTNMIPMDISFNLIAVDNSLSEVELFKEPIIIPKSNGYSPQSSEFKAGEINTTNPVIKTLDTELVDKLLKCSKLKFEFNASMPKMANGNHTSVYSGANLTLKLTGNLKGEI